MGIFQHMACWKMPIKHIKHSNMPIKHKSAWTNLPTRMILRPHTLPSNRESFALRCWSSASAPDTPSSANISISEINSRTRAISVARIFPFNAMSWNKHGGNLRAFSAFVFLLNIMRPMLPSHDSFSGELLLSTRCQSLATLTNRFPLSSVLWVLISASPLICLIAYLHLLRIFILRLQY